MAVNVSKLWREGRFQSLSRDAKLLYIYLSTSPNINTLGLLNASPDSIQFDLSQSDSDFRKACVEVRDAGYVIIFKVGPQVYFYLPDHFPTLPKSVTVSKRVSKDIAKLPKDVVKYLDASGLIPDVDKHVEFKAPTVEDIESYALSKGYLVDAQAIIEFYEGKAKLFNKKGWYDSRGKAVKDWRGKLRKIWFKDENKLEKCEGAPKGFEYFFVKENGRNITPDKWKDGLPVSNGGFLETKILQREYKKKIEPNAQK